VIFQKSLLPTKRTFPWTTNLRRRTPIKLMHGRGA
jgi:hypothetical protein